MTDKLADVIARLKHEQGKAETPPKPKPKPKRKRKPRKSAPKPPVPMRDETVVGAAPCQVRTDWKPAITDADKALEAFITSDVEGGPPNPGDVVTYVHRTGTPGGADYRAETRTRKAQSVDVEAGTFIPLPFPHETEHIPQSIDDIRIIDRQ